MRIQHKKYLIFLILILVGVPACGVFGGGAPPDLLIIAAGEELSVPLGSHCWGGLCADAIFPPVIEKFVELPAGGQITLEFDGRNPESAFIGLDRYDTFPDAEYVASTRLDNVPDTIMWTPGVPAGNYVLAVSSQWGEGEDASYHIGVIVP